MTANSSRKYILFSILLMTVGVLFRLIPHPANIAPIGAIALLAGAKLPRKYAVTTVLVSMLLSDLILGTHSVMLYTWGSFILIVLLSSSVLQKTTVIRIAGMSLTASFLFFVLSNFGVWIHSGMYTHTLSGLIQTYVMALPFYQQTVIGDGMFALFLFGLYEIVIRLKETYTRTAELPLKNS